MTIRLGINPIGWSNDDMPALGGDTPLETCLAEARLAGYEGVELGGKFPRTAPALRDALAPHGLALASGWYAARLRERSAADEFAEARPHLALLRDMGCTVCVFAETAGTVHGDRAAPLSSRPVLAPSDWSEYGRRLTELARRFEADGIVLAVHHHMGTVIQTADEIDRLMETTGPEVGLLLDTGHALWGGADPAALAERHRDRIRHVHAKDVRPLIRARADREGWSFLDAVLGGVFTVPGDGAIDYAAVFRALFPYEGWVVVEAEQDPAEADPLEYARLGHRHLGRVLAETGHRA